MKKRSVRSILVGVVVMFVVPLMSMNMWASAGTRTNHNARQLPSDLPTDDLPDLPTDILPTDGDDDPSPGESESPIEVPTDVPTDIPTCVPGAPVDPVACPTVSPTATTSPTAKPTTGGATATSSPTTVTMKYAKGKFVGGVSSDSQSCVVERSVVVKRVKNGKKTTVGRDLTNAKGRYAVPKANAKPGRYFAKALSDTVDTSDCLSGRSKAVRLPLRKR